MRYWSWKLLQGPDIEKIDNVWERETCMDKCLANSKCISFNHSERHRICFLKGEPTGLYKNTMYYAGVRCDQDWKRSEKETGKYPAVLSGELFLSEAS